MFWFEECNLKIIFMVKWGEQVHVTFLLNQKAFYFQLLSHEDEESDWSFTAYFDLHSSATKNIANAVFFDVVILRLEYFTVHYECITQWYATDTCNSLFNI